MDDSNASNQQQPNNNKRRKLNHHQPPHKPITSVANWTTPNLQRRYSSNLLYALRRSPSSKPTHIRDTADRVLATAARGTTRWSRAILKSRVKLLRVKKVKRSNAGGLKRRRRRVVTSAAEKKAAVLSRLVPGCKKTSFANLLEEASDYIAALQMQVKAMTALAEIFSAGQPPNDSSS